ncbi:MAG: glycosyltransferase family 4 protein [Planctomycetes bacterium]|nr:glycosyltransferase family 4 protein [Planctomycetota bacterium]
MKVALVSEWLDGWRGGAETSTQQFIQHLLDRGVELHLYTRSRPSPTPQLHVHPISGAAMTRTRRSVTFAHRVDRMLRGEHFDIVHAISPCLGATIYQPRGGTVAESIERNLALRRPGTVRSLKRYANCFNVKQRHALALERRLMTDSQGPLIVAISDYVARQLRQHYAVPEQRVRVVYNGVNPDAASPSQRAMDRLTLRKELGVREGDCLVLLVAHNFRLKGVGPWMSALARLVQRGVTDVRTAVVGKGDSARWHRLAARLGLEPYLCFTGPTDRIAQHYHAADVLVHPTYYDPCSRVVLEALVSGLPVVTTRWDGSAEVVQEGVNGFVLSEPDDTDALADRVDRLRDRGLRERVGTAAQAVAARVSMERHTSEMIAVYEETMMGVGAPS